MELPPLPLQNQSNNNNSFASINDLVKAQKNLTSGGGLNKSDSAQLSAAAIQKYQASYTYSNTMTLNITTREGDKVSVDFRQLYAEYQEYTQSRREEDGPKGVRIFESRELLEATAFEERFGLSVEGDLNDDEMKALINIFEQVDRLANSFYGGNLEEALAHAQELDIDFGQIQSFDLEMTQTRTAAMKYQEIAQLEQPEDKETAEFSELPAYLQQMQAAVDALDDYFEEAQSFFENLMASILEQRFDKEEGAAANSGASNWLERVSSFHEKLQEIFKPALEEQTGNNPAEQNDEVLDTAEKI